MTDNRKYRLLVFDWDGTLMDSEARIVACIHAAARDLGLAELDRTAIRNIIGLGLREAIEQLFPGADEDIHRDMVERYRYHYLTADPTPSELFAGAEQTVRALSEAGYLLAVATGKGRVGLDQAMAQTPLGQYFHITRCADETFSKPNPQMLLEVMEFTGSTPGETLMIGDSEYDILMARNAGTDALAVSYGVHELPRLLAHGAIGHIDAIDELNDWLTQNEAATQQRVLQGA